MAPEERPLRGAADIAIPGIAINHYLQFRFRGCGSASVSHSFSSDASFLNDLRPFFDIFLHELFQFVGRAGYDFGTLPCQRLASVPRRQNGHALGREPVEMSRGVPAGAMSPSQ